MGAVIYLSPASRKPAAATAPVVSGLPDFVDCFKALRSGSLSIDMLERMDPRDLTTFANFIRNLSTTPAGVGQTTGGVQ